MKYAIAVRELCEFTAKKGDLDLRFTPSPSAQEGIAGHAVVAARRQRAGYQSEVSLTQEFQHLLVRGRADGYDAVNNRLEEVKTYRGKLDALPDNHRQLHWAQAKMYGSMLCEQLGLKEMHIALVYFDIGSQRETVVCELFDAASLKAYFDAQCRLFLAWADQELAYRSARNAALSALRFPYPAFRQGQRQLAEAAYKSAVTGRSLMIEAPTGIGKTIGTLFPLLKACPGQALDKLFFLSAKTSGRGLALDALQKIKNSEPQLANLRVVELVARDKACEHPGSACHGDACPLAKGFYDRLPQARAAAVQTGLLDRAGMRQVALQHQVCPYYLSQDLVRWADVVVGDYNYYFDLHAMLYGLTVANQWKITVLVDEAHNMIERARKMYSAQLDQRMLASARQDAPAAVKGALDRLHRQWTALNKEQTEAYQVHAQLPGKLLESLQHAISAMTDYFADNPVLHAAGLQDFYFEALHLAHMAELFGEHSLFDLSLHTYLRNNGRQQSRSILCIRNVVPAPFLAPRFAAARNAVLFSGTFSPASFYQDMLGMPENSVWMEVESPFDASQLMVQVVDSISTRYQQRTESLAPIVELMAQQYRKQPGNYLSFVSSFDYLEQLVTLFQERHPDVPVWQQSRNMDEVEREHFLAKFTPDGQGIGFAVLGGAFAEGVDLVGERLIGAFIATLGLPQVNPVNEQMKKRMQASFGAGYDYTYFYPGIQKVIQAAGRVIRTQSDRGVVFLIDDRFNQPKVRRLLPSWWKIAGA